MKKAISIVGAILALLAVLVAVLYFTPWGDSIFRKPEDILYKNLTIESSAETAVRQKNTTLTDTVTISSEQYFNGKDTAKATANIRCTTTDDDLGKTTVDMDARLINGDFYTKVNGISSDKLSGLELELFNGYVDQISGKWVKNDDPQYSGASLKDNGFSFGAIGYYGDVDTDKMNAAFKDNSVYEITNQKKEGSGSDRYYVLTVTTRRSNLSKAVESYDSDFKNLDKLLDEVFDDDDSVETDIAIRISDGKTLWQESDESNLCKEATGNNDDLPNRVRIRLEPTSIDSVKSLSAPSGAITEEEYGKLTS